jgi:predicted lipase
MHHNPVKDEYEGRTDSIGLHKGFSNYLLRKRKEVVGKSKLDEILDEVRIKGLTTFGNEKYRQRVVGHSLGGSLATLFGFYASTNAKLDAFLPVDVFSFCAPKVGGIHFALAFQKQEETKRLRHFRFFHRLDVVSFSMLLCRFPEGVPDFDCYCAFYVIVNCLSHTRVP